MTATRFKPLDWRDFMEGMNHYLRDECDNDYRETMTHAIENPQKWFAEAKCGLCQLIDGRAK